MARLVRSWKKEAARQQIAEEVFTLLARRPWIDVELGDDGRDDSVQVQPLLDQRPDATTGGVEFVHLVGRQVYQDRTFAEHPEDDVGADTHGGGRMPDQKNRMLTPIVARQKSKLLAMGMTPLLDGRSSRRM